MPQSRRDFIKKINPILFGSGIIQVEVYYAKRISKSEKKRAFQKSIATVDPLQKEIMLMVYAKDTGNLRMVNTLQKEITWKEIRMESGNSIFKMEKLHLKENILKAMKMASTSFILTMERFVKNVTTV